MSDDLQRLRRENQRLRKALEINQLIAGELNLPTLLRKIMEITRKLMHAESCSLFLIEPGQGDQGDEHGGDLVFYATTGENEAQLREVCRLKPGSGIAGWCAAKNETVRLNDVYADPRFNDEYDRMTGFTTHNMICVPLVARGAVIGVSQVINQRDGDFNEGDEALLESVMQLVSIAIDNARTHEQLMSQQLLSHDLELAKSIQSSFLPAQLPPVAGYASAAYISSALEVGGDFYDAFQLSDGRMAYLLGDISGKGVSAAMVMSSVLHELRAEVNRGGRAGEILTRYNRSFCGSASNGMFSTIVLMLLDPASGSIETANAGHPPPVHLHRDRLWQQNEASGPPVGVILDAWDDSEVHELAPGELVLLFSDGVPDARNAYDEMLGMGRLLNWMEAAPSEAGGCIDYLNEQLREYSDFAPQADDITLLALSRTS